MVKYDAWAHLLQCMCCQRTYIYRYMTCCTTVCNAVYSLFVIMTSGYMSSEADRLWSVFCVSKIRYHDDTQLASTPLAISKFITTHLLHKDVCDNLRMEHHAGQAHRCTGMPSTLKIVNQALNHVCNAKAASNKNQVSAFEQVLHFIPKLACRST